MTGMDKIKIVKRDFLKTRFCFPGGYEIALYLEDGQRLCRDCTLENWASIVGQTLRPGESPGWGILGVDVYWEGPTEQCGHCAQEFASEYGDPAKEQS